MKLLISGALGRMGRAVYESAGKNENVTVIAGVDVNAEKSNLPYPVYATFNEVKEKPDCIVDFSAPAALDGLLSYAAENDVPAVLCATGYTDAQKEKIAKHAENHAAFRSANMSIGVNVLINLCKKAAAALDNFDIEIIEKHHNQKVDAPSGTALMLAEGIKAVDNEKHFVYGREGNVGKRDKNEIGIHAVRGGTIVGEHEVIFAGTNEVVTLKHTAESRAVFAEGAIKAALFMTGKKSGLYDMQNVIENA